MMTWTPFSYQKFDIWETLSIKFECVRAPNVAVKTRLPLLWPDINHEWPETNLDSHYLISALFLSVLVRLVWLDAWKTPWAVMVSRSVALVPKHLFSSPMVLWAVCVSAVTLKRKSRLKKQKCKQNLPQNLNAPLKPWQKYTMEVSTTDHWIRLITRSENNQKLF